MSTTETKAQPERVPFGVEHIKPHCREILWPKLQKPRCHEDLLFGWRLNDLDLGSSCGFRWPFPGHWARAAGPFTVSDNPCPSKEGDGLCIAKTIQGAQSGVGRLGKSVGLLVAYLQDDVLAESPQKLRVKRAWVADQFDPVRVLLASDADLRGADLRDADLGGANLTGAYLTGAYLRNADLGGANLGDADLRGANLTGAYLGDADLEGANLTGAYLGDADLRGANLTGAYLRNADLRGANLTGAYLRNADLGDAKHTQQTLWPAGFDPSAARAVLIP